MLVEARRMQRYQLGMVALMVVGYAGYYICRSDFSVALPLIIAELAARGATTPAGAKIALGGVASVAVLAYALGKFASGALSDRIGGKPNFLGGMAGSILFTIVFALGGTIPIFTIAWVANRFVQSTGWVGMIALVSKWFPYSQYGTVMGVISLSYLLGDAASRAFLGVLITHGMGWRGCFLTAAAVLGVLGIINALWLRESPSTVGLPAPADSPTVLVGAGVGTDRLATTTVLRDLAGSPAFWIACVLSLGFTLMRETFNTWTPTYFTEALALPAGEAARESAWFPVLGAASVLIAGAASDRLGRGGRARIMFVGLLATMSLLLVLAHGSFGRSQVWPVVVVAATGFAMLGPYSYLAGAISLDFGGQRASATVCGLIDGVGYLGGVLAGDSMARVSVALGWRHAFDVLAAVAAAAAVAALIFVWHQREVRHE
ncbi:MAG TPA: MFS transporter [Gemmatimonadaceae bacterium]|nr:MFS transporter [Gemmatimonadaceae bacterium]